MSSGDLRTELTLQVLTPAASDGTGEGHTPHPNGERKSRRRSRFEHDGSDDAPPSDSSESAANDTNPHQFDRLA